jgi:hypothetical protein
MTTVYVCPERDIECGRNPATWCASCPQRATTQPREQADDPLRDLPDFDAKVLARAALARQVAPKAPDSEQQKFCDSHCVWTDHHPDCTLLQDATSKQQACTCVYATSDNTDSVRKGYEMGGYLKQECDACKAAATTASTGPKVRAVMPDNAPLVQAHRQLEATTASASIDLSKLAAIADRVRARGLFNASCDILDWIQEVHTILARRAPAQQTERMQPSQEAAPITTAEEFFAEARRLGCKLPDDICAILAKNDAAQAAHAGADTNAARDVLAERRRQVEVEGWTPARDDGYTDYSLARAAATYAIAATVDRADRAVMDDPNTCGITAELRRLWPASWLPEWLKPKSRRADLVKSGALILAEIERLDRAAMSAATKQEPKP